MYDDACDASTRSVQLFAHKGTSIIGELADAILAQIHCHVKLCPMLYDCTIECYYYSLSDIVFNLIINICDDLKCVHNKKATLNINFKCVFLRVQVFYSPSLYTVACIPCRTSIYLLKLNSVR